MTAPVLVVVDVAADAAVVASDSFRSSSFPILNSIAHSVIVAKILTHAQYDWCCSNNKCVSGTERKVSE